MTDQAVRPTGDGVSVSTKRRLDMDGVDAFGIVFYARYWEWYQHAFEELLRVLGHPLPELLSNGVGFPAVHAEIDYREMLTLDDVVHCDLWPVEVGNRSLRMTAVFTNDQGREVARASTVHVVTGRDRSKPSMPAWLRDAVATATASPSADTAHGIQK